MSRPPTFYNVVDTITGEKIYESMDAYYIGVQMGIPYQMIVGCACTGKRLFDRYVVVKEGETPYTFDPTFRKWFSKEWKKMQDMFHVKHS